MENLFSIGEVARYQNISKQTLIFSDKIGLFRPAYVDPHNGYRYYIASLWRRSAGICSTTTWTAAWPCCTGSWT